MGKQKQNWLSIYDKFSCIPSFKWGLAAVTTSRGTRPFGRTCSFQDCNLQTSDQDHPLCRQHYFEAQRRTTTKCSRRPNFKSARLPLCSNCFVGGSQHGATRRQQSTTKPSSGTYEIERSPAWERGDTTATYFYTYILRLSTGEFYVGHTRELPERLSEHRDGRVSSTKDKSPELVWFTELPSREEAASLESKLKQVRDRDERSIRRMIIRFQGLVRELSRD